MNTKFFRPILWEALRGYTRSDFFKDLGAGTTVGIIALPLAIGFGIASGVSPAQGLWTAIVAGALIAALGGSRFQIGGPTGAFVPVLAAIVAAHGYVGLALATMMAGVMLLLMGALRLGGLLKFIPYPVVAGFTTGIAVIIFTAQLNEALGLDLKMPEHVPQQLSALAVRGKLARHRDRCFDAGHPPGIAARDEGGAAEHRCGGRHHRAGGGAGLADRHGGIEI